MTSLDTLPVRHRTAALIHDLARPATAAVIAQLPARRGASTPSEVVRTRSALPLREFWITVSRLEQRGILHRDAVGLSLDHDRLERLLSDCVADSPLHPIIASRPRLRSFVTWGRLTRTPTDPALLDELYDGLVELFEQGELLSEAEVNARIAVVHDDPAEVRRGLVDRGLLQRKPGSATYTRG